VVSASVFTPNWLSNGKARMQRDPIPKKISQDFSIADHLFSTHPHPTRNPIAA
jgi:hypothetical protein